MQYKGEDMDLRVPQVRAPRDPYGPLDNETLASSGRWPRSTLHSVSAGEPLWVDETLLACCNYAFDIAVANGSLEVGLEHLVNALTRVENAARILEARGVREAQLRRDSAALIASEVPVAPAGDKGTPRRSADFEEVLRRAVEIALRRGTAAGVDDVLWVLLHFGRDVAAVALLRRLAPEWQRLDWGRMREPQPAYIEPRPAPPPALYEPYPSRTNYLEDALRGLQAEIMTERKMLVDLVRDMQRDVVSQRGDLAALRGDIGQRLETIERQVQTRGGPQLTERLQSLEKAVHSGLGEGARNWAALTQRLQTFEQTLSKPGADLTSPALAEKLTEIGKLAGGAQEENSRHWTALDERLSRLEAGLTQRLSSVTADSGTFSDRVAGLERAVHAGFGQHLEAVTLVAERITSVETRLGQPLAATASSDEAVLLLDEKLQVLEQLVERRATESASRGTEIVARLKHLDEGLERVYDKPIPPAAVSAPISLEPIVQRLTALEQQVAMRVNAMHQATQAVTQRFGAFEQVLKTETAQLREHLRGSDREMDAVHDSLGRLAESQIAISSAITDWRNSAQVDLGRLSEKLDAAFVPVSALEEGLRDTDTLDYPSVVTDAPANANDAIETDEVTFRKPEPTAPQKRGFRWWLFGTNNVTEANREAEIRWQRMHQGLKDARDRRRNRTT